MSRTEGSSSTPELLGVIRNTLSAGRIELVKRFPQCFFLRVVVGLSVGEGLVRAPKLLESSDLARVKSESLLVAELVERS